VLREVKEIFGKINSGIQGVLGYKVYISPENVKAKIEELN